MSTANSKENSRLAGKVAVITGGNSGIGRATAERFASEGARVVVFGRDKKTLDDTIASLGAEHVGVQGDVTSGDDLDRLFATTSERFGKIDVLFANAGGGQAVPFADVDEATFDQQFGVNVKGLFFTVQKALPLFDGGGSIILTGSVADRLGMPGLSVYSATKAAVRSLARSLSAELVGSGIRVNTLNPGPIETPIFGRMGLAEKDVEAMGATILGRVPMQRMGQASEIADAAVFLASNESSYVLGTELVVDGGMSQL